MKDQIIAAARKRGRTKEIVLGDDMKVVVHELSPNERKALNDIIFEKKEDGSRVLIDVDGKLDDKGEYYKVKDGKNLRHEWIRATMTPAEAVDGILSDDVPESVRDEIFSAAQAVNGFEIKEAVKN